MDVREFKSLNMTYILPVNKNLHLYLLFLFKHYSLLIFLHCQLTSFALNFSTSRFAGALFTSISLDIRCQCASKYHNLHAQRKGVIEGTTSVLTWCNPLHSLQSISPVLSFVSTSTHLLIYKYLMILHRQLQGF